jgi:hypothetical protein
MYEFEIVLQIMTPVCIQGCQYLRTRITYETFGNVGKKNVQEP